MKIFNRFLLLSLFILTSCRTHFVATSHDKQLYKITSNNPTDTLSDIEKYLKPFRDSLYHTMNEVIGEAMGDFLKEKPSGSLGNLVVDAMLYEARNSKFQIPNKDSQHTTYNLQLISGAITNPGGLRMNQIPKGTITKGKIFELLPFENELVIVEVKGKIVKQWLELIKNNGGWPMAGDITLFSTGLPNFQEDATYYIATNDYVANGGDNCSFLIPCKKYSTGKTIRDLVIAFIQKSKTIVPNKTASFPHIGE